jgi:hypothetical protein
MLQLLELISPYMSNKQVSVDKCQQLAFSQSSQFFVEEAKHLQDTVWVMKPSSQWSSKYSQFGDRIWFTCLINSKGNIIFGCKMLWFGNFFPWFAHKGLLSRWPWKANGSKNEAFGD